MSGRGPGAGTTATERVWAKITEGLLDDPRERLNIYRECSERWREEPGRTAFVIARPGGRSEHWSHDDLGRAAARAARLYARLGLERGDRVAGVVGRQAETWVCALGAWRAGLVWVPLYSGFGPGALAERIAACEPRAVVVDAQWRPGLTDALDRAGGDPAVLTVTENGRGAEPGDRDLWGELEACAPDGPSVDTAADEVAAIVFTSGTTGTPKGCLVPHGGFLALVPWFVHGTALSPREPLFAAADPGWSFGLIAIGIVPLQRGVPLILPGGGFDADAWAAAIRDHAAAHVAAAPSVYRRLGPAVAAAGAPPTLQGATSGGEPMDAPTATAWREATGTAVGNVYGQTEVGAVLGDLAGGEPRAGSLGLPVPGFELALVEPETRAGLVEGPGEGVIAVRRPPFQQSIGYSNAPGAWEERWLEEEWFLTGDVGRRDEDGVWWFVGRGDDVIVTSGINVGPGEVESVLHAHPDVAEVAAVSARDRERDRDVVRAVVVTAGRTPSDELTSELQQLVADRIGRHAKPRIVDYVDALPRTEAGKLRRSALRDD